MSKSNGVMKEELMLLNIGQIQWFSSSKPELISTKIIFSSYFSEDIIC